MKNTKNKLINQSKIVKSSFTGSNITKYSGLNTVAKYMNRQNIVKTFGKSFPTGWYNATKFGVNQILMAITLSSITGSAYTSNGIVDFLKEVKSSLPKNIAKVFFRADSGFFSGGLFDLLEFFTWDYLVKVKLKNLERLLQLQTWLEIKGQKDVAICEFIYTAKGWSKPRILRAMRSVMMRQKKNKFKQQEHRSFIDWFIAVPAKITISGHQIELKMYEHHFYKDAWEVLDRLIEAA